MKGITGNKGLDMWIMDSHYKLQKLKNGFNQCIAKGLDVNQYQDTIYSQLNIYPSDLTEPDKQELKRYVETKVRRSGKYV